MRNIQGFWISYFLINNLTKMLPSTNYVIFTTTDIKRHKEKCLCVTHNFSAFTWLLIEGNKCISIRCVMIGCGTKMIFLQFDTRIIAVLYHYPGDENDLLPELWRFTLILQRSQIFCTTTQFYKWNNIEYFSNIINYINRIKSNILGHYSSGLNTFMMQKSSTMGPISK